MGRTVVASPGELAEGPQRSGFEGSFLEIAARGLAFTPAPRHLRRLFSRRSFLTQAGALALGGAGAWLLRDHVLWPAPKASFRNGAADSGWLPFVQRRDGAATLEVRINGLTVGALLDSGAQYSVVDRVFASQLGLGAGAPIPMIAYGVGGGPQLGRGASLDLTAGDLALTGLKAAMLELGPIAGGAGLAVPLILGQDVLQQLLADIDFPRRRLRFGPAETYPLPQGALRTPSRRQGRALLAEIAVEGAAMEVVVDTGASSALGLAAPAAEAAGLLDGRPVRSAETLVLGGTMQGRVVRAKSLDFAGATYRDVAVHIYEPQPIPGFPRGLLGVEALRRFRVVLDHPRGALHVAS